MRLVAHNGFNDPVDIPFTELLIYDDFNNIIGAVVQYDDNTCEIVHCHDKEFRKVLSVLSLDKVIPELSTIDSRNFPRV